MIGGVDVMVSASGPTGEVDDSGEPVAATTWRRVPNVLFDPGATSSVSEAARANGTVVDAELHFPKAFKEALKGRRVAVREDRGGGEEEWAVYEVVGDPRPYTDADTPGEWDRVVMGRLVDG